MTFNIHSCKGVAQVGEQRNTCIKNLKLRQTVLDRVWSSLGIQQNISHLKGALPILLGSLPPLTHIPPAAYPSELPTPTTHISPAAYPSDCNSGFLKLISLTVI